MRENSLGGRDVGLSWHSTIKEMGPSSVGCVSMGTEQCVVVILFVLSS